MFKMFHYRDAPITSDTILIPISVCEYLCTHTQYQMKQVFCKLQFSVCYKFSFCSCQGRLEKCHKAILKIMSTLFSVMIVAHGVWPNFTLNRVSHSNNQLCELIWILNNVKLALEHLLCKVVIMPNDSFVNYSIN